MSVMTEIFNRVHVDFEHEKSTNSSPPGRFDGQVTQEMSMAGANNVQLTVDLIAWKGTGSTKREVAVFLHQSNDRCNWFAVSPTGPSVLKEDPLGPVNQVQPSYSNVGMAYVRVVLLMDTDGTRDLATGDGAVVNVDLTTSA